MADGDENEDDVKAIPVIIAALKPLDAESRTRVLEFVLKKLGMSLSANAPHIPAPPALGTLAAPMAPLPPNPPAAGVRDIRSFAAEKNPKTVNEKVAVIGYYLANLALDGERRDYLTSDDIKPYFIQAGFALPTAAPAMTLTNAKNAGYLNALGGGQYKLNAVGHNLVAHKLPGGGAGEAKHARKKSTTRKKAGK